MLKLGSLIVRNVLRNRRRTLLTLASSAVSLAVLGLLAALYQGFFFAEESSPSEALRLIARHKVSLTNPLPASHQARIVSIDGVAAVSAYSWFGGKYKDARDPKNFFARFAVDPDTVQKVRPDFEAPAEQWAAFQRNRAGCAVARKIAEQHSFKLGDRITLVGDIYPVTLELTIEAIFDHPKNTEQVFFQRTYLDELLKAAGREANTVGTFAILARTPEDVPRVARAVDAMFENSPAPTKTETEREFGLSFMAFLGNIKLYLAVVCAAVTFTILLVSANTIAMSVRERTRELAILRTLGYAPTEIMGMVLGESILIAVIGGLIGIAITFALTLTAAAFMGPMAAAMTFRWQAVAIVAGFAVLIGLASAFVPAVFASRRNIVESIRFVG